MFIVGAIMNLYEFKGVIHDVPEKGGAYVTFPYDSREEFASYI